MWLGFICHELAHFLAGLSFGEDMMMTLNSVWPTDGGYDTPAKANIVTATGPIFTVTMALAGFWFVYRKSSLIGYAVVYSAFVMRFCAFMISFIGLNDEARLSVYFGMPWFVFPALVSVFLLGLTVSACRKLRIGWKTNLLAFLVSVLAIMGLVAADTQVKALL